ncbi:MAG: PTS sugar transporter subunit IIA [Pseudomonadota bacterium]
MELGGLLTPACVVANLQAADKKTLLQQIAAHAAPLLNLEAEDVFDALLQRERLGTTGLGHGIALPHARIAGLETVSGFFAHLAKPVDFNAVDKEPVDLVFALFAPVDAGADHLNALVQVSRFLRDEKNIMHLRATRDDNVLHALLTMPAQKYAA